MIESRVLPDEEQPPAVAHVQVYGVRHHGPGSARAVRRALEEFEPDAVLVEGPPEADPLLELAGDPAMVPPVALLAYSPGLDAAGTGRRAAFWPFAGFSPEWQAIRYAVGAGVPVRFCDLPAANQFVAASGEQDDGDDVRLDPLGALAEAAGYDDAERWWDDVVEHRSGEDSPFAAIAEAMAELRAALPVPAAGGYRRREEQREAYMRRTLRRALKDGHERIAVVCGAWHVPALLEQVPAAADDQTLRGLPKARVAMTWVPWTHGRLAGRSGYGAGVRSPGWYHHLFTAPDRPVERWLTDAARLLRGEDLHVSSAHVIEAVRLADALATLRGRPLAGLEEVTEATRAVLCEGSDLPLELIHRRMVVGERLGVVPARTPMVPLQRDLHAEQRRLRLKAVPDPKDQDLDLRKPTDLDRSRLLHRLRLIEVEWGVPKEEGRSRGTFREAWTLAWRPEFDVELIEASAWGTTVRDASAARAQAMAADAGPLPELTALAERCLLADLPEALPEVTRALADRAATDTDVAHLMEALPALVRALRYGDVRGTATGPLREVVDALAVRVRVGLPPATTALDDDAAESLLDRIDAVHAALALLADQDHLTAWQRTLASLLDHPGLHGLLEGRLTRLLLDAGLLPDVTARMARAVSTGAAPARAAAWVEGFLAGGALILTHDDELLRLLDAWIAELPPDSFTAVLPLLRRTFGGYTAAERRAIADRARFTTSPPGETLDPARAAPATATTLRILGWETP
ncbi:DUF5682 family protein [Actinomadura hibisca]|uniref:DUF5682 family protein n=1 Tax=Actinomadura hibisca TaxID=68565 RepID=UPI000B181F51|nr:DUF5682 family protein [Actinomadura hibisca]